MRTEDSASIACPATYLQSLSTEQRRRSGTVYTPEELAQLILDLAGYTPEHPLESSRLIDPACGCGIFLIQALARLAERLVGLGHDLSTSDGATQLADIAERTIFGIDKDPFACRLSHELVLREIARLAPGFEPSREFFKGNIIQSDFLIGPLADLQEHLGGQATFDFVVGNPPYVSATRLDHKDKEELRKIYRSAKGRLDLYLLFFERGLDFLNSEGALAYITPDKFLTSESARNLRRLITERATLTHMARFRSHKVFAEAATVPCITVLRNFKEVSEIHPIDYLECDFSPSTRLRILDQRTTRLPGNPTNPWHFLDPKLADIADRMANGSQSLEELTARISAGIATGRDSIFVVPEKIARSLEPDLLHPAVRGKDLHPFKIDSSKEWIIIPYLNNEAGEPYLVDLEEFPKTMDYLMKMRVELETRHCVRVWGKTWYDLHDPWTWPLTETPKILFPDIANSNRFALDAQGKKVPLHSAYYLIPTKISAELLVALLNSVVLEFAIRLKAPKVKDGFSRYRKQFLRNLPIPKLEPPLARRLEHAARAGDLETVDRWVADAYDLSSRDLDVIRDFVEVARGGHLQGARNAA